MVSFLFEYLTDKVHTETDQYKAQFYNFNCGFLFSVWFALGDVASPVTQPQFNNVNYVQSNGGNIKSGFVGWFRLPAVQQSDCEKSKSLLALRVSRSNSAAASLRARLILCSGVSFKPLELGRGEPLALLPPGEPVPDFFVNNELKKLARTPSPPGVLGFLLASIWKNTYELRCQILNNLIIICEELQRFY